MTASFLPTGTERKRIYSVPPLAYPEGEEIVRRPRGQKIIVELACGAAAAVAAAQSSVSVEGS